MYTDDNLLLLGNLNSEWTPKITLRANLVAFPFYWKLNVSLSRKYN